MKIAYRCPTCDGSGVVEFPKVNHHWECESCNGQKVVDYDTVVQIALQHPYSDNFEKAEFIDKIVREAEEGK